MIKHYELYIKLTVTKYFQTLLFELLLLPGVLYLKHLNLSAWLL